MNTPPADGLRMICLACGKSVRDQDKEDETEESVQRRFRTFSFGPDSQSVSVSLIAMVCPECVDVDMQSLRRIMYNIVFQGVENAESPVRIDSP